MPKFTIVMPDTKTTLDYVGEAVPRTGEYIDAIGSANRLVTKVVHVMRGRYGHGSASLIMDIYVYLGEPEK